MFDYISRDDPNFVITDRRLDETGRFAVGFFYYKRRLRLPWRRRG